ncbi:MAG: hypothetical protein NC084_13430, partial [Bacteroides sp.]|nr:hypothetical protein [Bacteroides sp.]
MLKAIFIEKSFPLDLIFIVRLLNFIVTVKGSYGIPISPRNFVPNNRAVLFSDIRRRGQRSVRFRDRRPLVGGEYRRRSGDRRREPDRARAEQG